MSVTTGMRVFMPHPIIPGMSVIRRRVKSMMTPSIQGPATDSATTSMSSFGMNDSVISLICVAAWIMPTSKPTASAESSSGEASSIVTQRACCPMVVTVSGVMGASSDVETRGQRAEHHGPAVHQHEQHDLERQRDEHGREHHHAHRHQHAGHDQVDDQERNEHQETDLEGGLQFADDEARH